METPPSTKRGKGGRKKLTVSMGMGVKPQKKSFSWGKALRFRMAEYVRENFSKYQDYSKKGKKMDFMRQMRDALGIECDDTQLKNGFNFFMGKYDTVRQKLNASGFGIDPEKDASLIKGGWIQRMCPYFDILDEVMACRPNVTPPSIVSTAMNFDDMEDNSDVMVFSQEELDDAQDDALKENNEDFFEDSQSCSGIQIVSTCSKNSQPDPTPIQNFVKDAFIKISSPKDESKTPMGIFTKIMSDKMELEERRFQTQMQMQQKQVELESKKLDVEREQMRDRALEREHELAKIRMAHEFELQKLQLQLRQSQNNE